jgi:hypothetical protein
MQIKSNSLILDNYRGRSNATLKRNLLTTEEVCMSSAAQIIFAIIHTTNWLEM